MRQRKEGMSSLALEQGRNHVKLELLFIAYKGSYSERPWMSNISMFDEYAKFWQMPFEKVMRSSCDGTDRVSNFTQ